MSVLAAGIAAALLQAGAAAEPSEPLPELRVMAWNIWRGGRQDGDDAGPARVVDVLRESGADLVAMQETYGSGERIAEALGFHFHPRGTNVSIHSRYPVVEDISVFEEFKCVGALVELPDATRVAFYSIWLPYGAEIWEAGTRDLDDRDALLAACAPSAADLRAIAAAIEVRLSGPDYEGVPVVVAGDFNSMSPLDYGEVGVDQYGAVVDWPTGHVLARAGFVDSYRECNPRIDRAADSTWTPRFPDQEQDRIDFVWYRAQSWGASASRVIREHADGFPSDHAAVLTTLGRRAPPVGPTPLRAVSYNIRHGVGTDGELDLARTAAVLRDLEADFVGLQEVDLGAARSGGVNQALELGTALGLHPAFGSFMDYQGGRYGMAVLSRHPIVDVTSLRLPDGNEPRVALLVEARLPDGRTVVVCNVHFDWVADDSFRFAQAELLAEHLRGRAGPTILLGDFNDGPGSRTLELFRGLGVELDKPEGGSATFPAGEPTKEIDFVFGVPADRWAIGEVRVVGEPVASDHRPVLAVMALTPEQD